MDRQANSEQDADGLNLLVVIVCYRVVDLTIQCLKSLASQVNDVPRTHVMVCDNGTGEEAVAALKRAIREHGWCSWVTLQAIEPNVGFTGGNNAVLREALSWPKPPKYYLLLNADTEVHPGAIKQLYDAMEQQPAYGVMGVALQGPDGRPHDSCFRDHSPLSEFLRGAGSGLLNRLFLRRDYQLRPTEGGTDFGWVSFACAMIRDSVIREVGLLDEGYFLYYDDADYCRVARNAGWKIGCCRESHVVHLEGQSNELPESARQLRRKPRYYYVSRSRYFAKHFGAAGLWLANIGWSLGSLFARVYRVVSKRSVPACEGEWCDIWTNALGPVRKSNASLLPKESRIV